MQRSLPRANALCERLTVTFLFIILNICIHFWGHGWGFVAADLHNQPLALVGYQFSHTDLDHLIGNMFLLLLIGPTCEKRLGSIRFALVYLTAGFISALGSVSLYPGSVLIGASGSISGLMAIYPFMQRTLVGLSLAGFIMGCLFYTQFNLGLASYAGLLNDSTAYMAHVAGGVAGLLMLCLLGRERRG